MRDAKKALSDAQSKAAALRQKQIESKELGEQNRALAQLALKLLNDKCPVCEQEYDVESTRFRLEALVNRPSDNLDDSSAGVDISEFVLRETEAQKKVEELDRIVAQRDKQQASIDQWEEECKDRLEKLDVHADDPATSKLRLVETLSELELAAKRIEKLVREGEKLSLNLAREAAQARIKSTTAALKDAKTELKKHQSSIASRESTTANVKLLIDQLREARSKVAIDKLSEIEPLLQKVFARIDPHPTFRVVKLATAFFRGKGRLDAEIKDPAQEKSTKSPEAVFSSSQLNACLLYTSPSPRD